MDFYVVFYLIHIELALAPGELSVAGGELSNKVMAEKRNLDRKIHTDRTGKLVSYINRW